MYAHGADAITVAAVRSVLAVPGFWLFALWRGGGGQMFRLPLRTFLVVIGAGFVCYYAGAYIDFLALELIDASLERVIMFSYPVVIVTVQIIWKRRLPGRRVLIAVALTYAGVFLAVGVHNTSLLAGNARGAAMVAVSACTLALYFLINARVAPRIGSQSFTVWAMTAAGLGFGAHYLVVADLSSLAGMSAGFWWLMALMVVGVTVLPLFLMAEGVSRVGATRGGLITTVGPPATVIMAHWFLGERMTALQLLGGALIVTGIIVLERRRAVSVPLQKVE